MKKEDVLELENQDMKYQIKILENQVDDGEEKYEVLNAKYELLNTQCQQLVTSSEEIELVNIEEIKNLQAKVDSYQEKIKKMRRELDAANDQKTFIMQENAKLSEDNDQFIKKLQDGSYELQKMQRENKALNQQVLQNQQNNLNSSQENETQKEQSKGYRQEILDLKGALAQKNTEIEKIKQGNKGQEEQLAMALIGVQQKDQKLKELQENQKNLTSLEKKIEQKTQQMQKDFDIKQKSTKSKYQEKFSTLQHKCQAEVQNKLKEYVQEIERLNTMVGEHEQEMVTAHEENIRAIDILQRSLKHVSYQYTKLSQLFPHSQLLPKTQSATNNCTLTLFTSMSSTDKHPAIEIKNNKMYLYKQADSNSLQGLKKPIQNKARYKFDSIIQGLQELVFIQEEQISLSSQNIYVLYGHKNSSKHRVLEQTIFVLLNKIRLMVNIEKLVNMSKSFQIKIKLYSYQQDQIDTLFEEKIDTDCTHIDQEMVTSLLLTLGGIINKEQENKLSFKVQVNSNYQQICQHRLIMTDLVQGQGKEDSHFMNQLQYIFKSVNIAKQEQSSNNVHFIFCVNSANQSNISIIEHTLKLLDNNNNNTSKFNLSNTKAKILMNESQQASGHKGTLVSLRSLVTVLQQDAKKFMNWIIESKVQDNQLKIKKLTLIHNQIRHVKEVIDGQVQQDYQTMTNMTQQTLQTEQDQLSKEGTSLNDC